MEPWQLPLVILLWIVVASIALFIGGLIVYTIVYIRRTLVHPTKPEHTFTGTGPDHGEA